MKATSQFYSALEKVGIVRYSGKKNIYGLHPLVISSLVIIFTLTLANILRKLFNLILKDNIAKEIVLEFIATAELCACCFELIIIADNYGVFAYAVYLFLMTIWWGIIWENATACPYNNVEDVLEGSKTISKAVILTIAQVLGGLVIFYYIQLIWSIELAETHIGRAYEDCTADLAVPKEYGAAIEGFATFFCRLMSRTLSETHLRYAHIIDAFFATSLVVAAFNYTGGYFNPALATSLKLGCDGNTLEEHLIVYWLGATAGAIVSVYFYRLPFIQKRLDRFREKVD